MNHPMVYSHAVVYKEKIGLSILEQSHPGDVIDPLSPIIEYVDEYTWDQTRSQTQTWPLHWFWIEADIGNLTIESGPLPTVPVFLTSVGKQARADWDPLRLYPYLRPRLNWEAAAYYLCTFDQPYSNTTLIEDLHHLAGGYRAHWKVGGGGSDRIHALPFIPASCRLRRILSGHLNHCLQRQASD